MSQVRVFPATAFSRLTSGILSYNFRCPPPSPKLKLALRFEGHDFPGSYLKKKSCCCSASDDESSADANDPYLMSNKERREWRMKIKRALEQFPDVEEELDRDEKSRKMQQLLADYPLVVDEEDPNWNEDADGWGFSLGQFFDKIVIKNKKKEEDYENYESEDEIVWKDDNYIRAIKDISAVDWEVTVFKDISPLIVFVHNRYKKPKENERVRNELEKAVGIIWNCKLPSPRCVAVDGVKESTLVNALGVSTFPQILYTKAGKILHREKVVRNAEEYSKIMAFFYYGGVKPVWFNVDECAQQNIPPILS